MSASTLNEWWTKLQRGQVGDGVATTDQSRSDCQIRSATHYENDHRSRSSLGILPYDVSSSRHRHERQTQGSSTTMTCHVGAHCFHQERPVSQQRSAFGANSISGALHLQQSTHSSTSLCGNVKQVHLGMKISLRAAARTCLLLLPPCRCRRVSRHQ
jgi:hypothetical protein